MKEVKKTKKVKAPVTVDQVPVKTKEVDVIDINFTTKPTKLNRLLGKLIGISWTTRKVVVEDK